MSRRRVQAVVVSLVALGLGATMLTSAFASHSWAGYHWARTTNPFTIRIGDNVAGTWDAALALASSDWSKSTVLDTTVIPGSVTNLRRCPPPPGKVEVCNTTYGFNGWLGIAGITVSGGHITSGYVKLNDSYFNSSTYNTPAWRNLVTCQEVGHTLGLDHQDENFGNANLGTCMDYTNSPGGNQHPNQHDYDQLASIYGHIDTTTTASSANASTRVRRPLPVPTTAACSGEHGIPNDAGPQDGEVFVCDLGAGALQITHVFWIPRGLPGAR